MKVIVVGSGGREHAIAKKLASSDSTETVITVPGNAGTNSNGHPKFKHMPGNSAWDTATVLAFIESEKPDLVVVGPEQYLANGIVDCLEPKGIRVFGPTKEAALIETGKIVTAGGRVANVVALATNLNEAIINAKRHAHEIEFVGKHYRQDIGAKYA